MSTEKKTIKDLISEINNVVNNMPTLKESLVFNEEDRIKKHDEFQDDEIPDTDMTDDERISDDSGMSNDSEVNANVEHKPEVKNDLVNTIRKMALEGMSKLASSTDDPNYDILKKIWQFCDKKSGDKKNIENTDNF